jgi:voltage-gated potassium channel
LETNEKEKFEEIKSTLPGDKRFHVRHRKQRRKLRIVPNIPGILRFIRDVVTKTPLLLLMLALVVLWLLTSWGIYLVEHDVNEYMSSYTHTLWWSFAAMQTQGAPAPITNVGIIIGAVWSVISTIAFFGVIIGTMYSYYTIPQRHFSRELIGALQYNLEELEDLSIDELEGLKDTVARLVNVQVSRLKKNNQNH